MQFPISRNLNSTVYQRIEKLAFGIKFNYQSYLIINSSYTSHMIDLYITLPNHFPNLEPIELTPGYTNHIELEMIRIKRIKEHVNCHENTYSTMIYDGDLLTKRKIYGNGELCHRILSQFLYVNECNCYSPFLPYGYYNHLIQSSTNKPILCLNMSIFNNEQLANNSNCMYHVYQKYSNTSLYMSLLEAKQCDYYQYSPNCDNVHYNHLGIHRKTMTELWSNTYNEARAAFLISSFRDVFTDTTINNTTTYNHYNSNILLSTHEILTKMRNNFGLLTIERSTSQGKLIREEQEYSLAQLLSDIGGNMGLWIGISKKTIQ
ncbi:degenerin unc-8 [Schistosoma japonicum]|nr:degenerin unc-8 [Schistosoma japonicum]